MVPVDKLGHDRWNPLSGQLRPLQDARRGSSRSSSSRRTGGVTARLHDVARSQVANQQVFPLPPTTDAGFRLEVHRLSDEIARWASGTPGIGGDPVSCSCPAGGSTGWTATGPISSADAGGPDSLSPAWSPDGQQFAYTQLGAGRGGIVVQTSGERRDLPGAGPASGTQHHAGVLPDGRTLAYAHSDESGTDIYTANVVDRCCAQRLTVGRYRGQLVSNVFARRAAHRVRFHACRTASDLRHGRGRDRSGAAGAVRFRRHRRSNAPEWSPGRGQCRLPPRSLRQPANLPGRRRGRTECGR